MILLRKKKQTNSQSDLALTSNFAGPSYFTVRSFVCVILIWDPCIFNVNNLCQTESWVGNRTNVSFISTNKWQQHSSFCYSFLLGQFQLKLFCCGKGRQNFASNVTLYPCERSRQNHLVSLASRSAFCNHRKGVGRIEALIPSFELDNSGVLISWETLQLTQWKQYYNQIEKYITLRQVNLTLWVIKLIILHKFQVKRMR